MAYFSESNEMLDDARSTQPCFSEETKLGVVFDIDGTLIGLNKRDEYQGIKIRDDGIEFIQWLKSRGHHVSIWTKASKFWAHSVVKKICTLIHGVHGCTGYKCRKTFDSIWCDDMLRKVKTPNPQWCFTGRDDECKWCEAYSSTCTECECIWDDDECPCRKVKDLRKIWYSSEEATKGFVEERTLIIEDTPQNCRYNYGNTFPGTGVIQKRMARKAFSQDCSPISRKS
mmetsp:Transcript_4050/g.6339  ORF Transcript_4050/g.6339 Transcript_4050/m.6339 type:complete len:228 (-) Transcript_4050:2124-2807(-)